MVTLKAVVESLLFASQKPLSLKEIGAALASAAEYFEEEPEARRLAPSAALRSMSVLTPCGQSADTLIPRSPYATASHSANASAACLVTA